MANDFHRAARSIEQLSDDIDRNVNDAVADTLDTTESEAKANLGANNTNWTKRTRQSIRTRHIREGNVDKHVLKAGGAQAPHAKYVEFGTGAFFDGADVPGLRPYDTPAFSETLVDNIHGWVQTKPVVPRHYTDKRDLAWAIAETIAALGTRSQPFVRPAWYATEPLLEANVREAIHDAARSI